MDTAESETSPNILLGQKGEKAAAAFLARRGFDIIERNWRCGAGEVDIIATEDESLHFVEVKTRSNCDKGFPAEAVDASKRERYEKIACCYLRTYEPTDIPVCFDIVSIVATGENRAFLRFHRNAFASGD